MTTQSELQTFPPLEMWTEEVSEEDRKDKFCTCESTALFRNKPDQSIFLAARIAGLEVTFVLVGKNKWTTIYCPSYVCHCDQILYVQSPKAIWKISVSH